VVGVVLVARAAKHPEIVERLAKRMADFHAEKEKNLRPAGSAGAN
jgi:hypothetical protein